MSTERERRRAEKAQKAEIEAFERQNAEKIAAIIKEFPTLQSLLSGNDVWVVPGSKMDEFYYNPGYRTEDGNNHWRYDYSVTAGKITKLADSYTRNNNPVRHDFRGADFIIFVNYTQPVDPDKDWIDTETTVYDLRPAK